MSDCSYIYVSPNKLVSSADYCEHFCVIHHGKTKLFAHFEKRCSDNIPLSVIWYKDGNEFMETRSMPDGDYYFISDIEIKESGLYKAALKISANKLVEGCGSVDALIK